MKSSYLINNHPFLLTLMLFVFTFLLYRDSVQNDYTSVDSIAYTHNSEVQSGSAGIADIFTQPSHFGDNPHNLRSYRPLPSMILALEYSHYGNNPHINHFFNTILYSLLCALIFVSLRLLLKEQGLIIPLISTLLFIVHPIHTSVVASVAGIDEILWLLFAVCSLYFVIKHHDSKRIGYLTLSIISFSLAILSKESGLIMVALIPLALHTFRTTSAKRLALITAPFILLSLAYLIFAHQLIDPHHQATAAIDSIGTAVSAHGNALDKIASIFEMTGYGLKLVLFPHPLIWDYSFNQMPATTWANPYVILAASAMLGLLTYGILGARKRSAAAYGVLFFLAAIMFSSNCLFAIVSDFSERPLFAPSFGICLAAGVLLFRFETTASWKFRRVISYGLLTIVLALGGIATVKRIGDWRTNFTLVSQDISKNARSAKAHFVLAREYRQAAEQEKNPETKTGLLMQSVKESQAGLGIETQSAQAWFEVGITCYQLGDKEQAQKLYEKALAIQPDHSEALNSLGTVYFEKHDYDNAILCYEKILQHDSTHFRACANMGVVHHMRQNFNEAFRWYEKALTLRPNDRATNLNLAELYKSIHDTAAAEKYMKKAESLAP
jgi:tetratricopeptide (TPR) repeat protein